MKKKDFAVIPFNSTLIKDKYLVSNRLGGWDFLDKEEFRRLNTFTIKKDIPLFKRLYDKGLLADKNNLKRLIDNYRNINNSLFSDTVLHIAVLTTRCNLSCRYCQTKSSEGEDMSRRVAERILKYISDVRSRSLTLEFQGGEPLLNWDVLAFLVKRARKFCGNKNLRIVLVTNLTLFDEEKMKFLVDNNVDICTSLDGPRAVHDKNRVFANNKGSYDLVMANVKTFRKKFGRKISFLPTITRYSFKYFKEIIDEYVKLGRRSIALRSVNKIGAACRNWPNLGYSVDQYIRFYRKAMDYILELNKKGTRISERIACVILEKVLNKSDSGFVDLRSPCGAGRNVIVYMPNGDCFPCDEARMVGGEIFKLGNILKEDYEGLMKKENLLHLLEASLADLWDYNSAFFPWMGICPVINYAQQENIVPKIWCSTVHKIYNFQFRYIFEKILESDENLKIFKSWVSGNGGGR